LTEQASLQDITVRTDNLWKVYMLGGVEYAALRGVSISVKRGEFVAIVGPSGSGKSTLMNLLGTLDRPSKGEVYLDGVAVSTLQGDALASLRNKVIGFVFQSYNLVPYLRVMDNVVLPLVARGVSSSERTAKAKALLEYLGLGDQMTKKPNQLSGGQQQRVGIARALVNDPSIILADEPTGNLDTKTGESVMELLRQISSEKKVTVIMVTHNLEITDYCHRVIFVRDGVVEREAVSE
jgi:putative ABC transport system ATP-binding protein